MRVAAEKDFEALVPGLSEARRTERLNRTRAFLGLTATVCGVEVVPFDPRHRLALCGVENGFVMSGEGGAEDVLQFLWHMSPLWERRDQPEGMSERERLKALVLAGPVGEMARQVRVYIASQLADPPELQGDGGEAAPDYSNHVSWFAIEASFWMNVHGGFTLESYARTPYLVLQQLRRAWKVNNPDREFLPNGSSVVDHPVFRNFSDRLAADWHVARRAVIAEAILAQTTRLPG